MPVEVIECEQGTPEWFDARCGIATCSCFDDVQAKGKGITRRKYMHRLAGEIITREPAPEGYTNAHMERGKLMEDEARAHYCFAVDVDVEKVGFLRNGRTGGSPDRLIGRSGILEIKTKLPHLVVDCLTSDCFPADHVAQCQGLLWVGEREWIDLVVYWPKMPLFIKRAYRDETYIKTLAAEVARFNEELDAVVERVRRYGT